MQNPQTPNIPGVGAITDTLDFVKNLWGSMSLPGMSLPGMGAPVLSVDDLDKKIADLKAVEAWLNVNISMLRGTVQALEVQRGTIATLKTMSAAFAEAMKQPGADEKSVLAASPYAALFTPPAAAAKPQAAKAEPEAAAPAAGAPFMPDPTLWWNVLQDQFKQAVTSAMAPEAMASMGAMAKDAADRMSAAGGSGPATPAEPAAPAAPGGGGSAAKPRTPKARAGKA